MKIVKKIIKFIWKYIIRFPEIPLGILIAIYVLSKKETRDKYLNNVKEIASQSDNFKDAFYNNQENAKNTIESDTGINKMFFERKIFLYTFDLLFWTAFFKLFIL